MAKKLQLNFLFVCMSLISFAQAPSIQWQKSFGGSGGDGAVSINQTSDLGYIISGNSNSNDIDVSGNHGLDDYWVVKLDTNHAITWQKSLGGSGQESCYWAEQTADGGYIVCGSSDSNDGDVSGNSGMKDCWVVKLGATGALQWQKSYGGTQIDGATCLRQTADGGYIMAGNTYSNDIDVSGNHGGSDCWIVKLYAGGTIEWQKTLGGSGDEATQFIQQTSDGGYIVAVYSNSNDGNVTNNHGGLDYWVVKLDAAGNIQWQKSLGGTGSEFIAGVSQTFDGGYIIAGDSNSNNGDVSGNHGNYDCWIVKLDSGGTMQWQKAFGGSSAELCTSIRQTSDSGYVVSAITSSNNGDVSGNHGSEDYWVLKINNQGTMQWQKCLGGSNNDSGTSIAQTNDGGYIIAGYGNSNDGDATNNYGSSDYWIVKLSAPVGMEEINESITINIFPNPAIDEFRIDNSELKIKEIELYNANGEKVFEQHLTQDNQYVAVNVVDFSPGIYFISVTDQAGNKVTKKVVKM
jgi:Secretion system C-terminal sorting domain